STGAGKSQVQIAVRLIEHASDPMELFRNHARLPLHLGARGFTSGGNAPLGALPSEVRLALEMAAHEESERRALDGELALLAAAWREAEEIAGIADDLLMPEAVGAWLEKNKRLPSAPMRG